MTQVTGACRFFEGDPGPRLPYRPRNRTGSPSPRTGRREALTMRVRGSTYRSGRNSFQSER
jgi:hypothetical protein